MSANSLPGVHSLSRSNEYAGLIQRLCQAPTVVAVIGTGYANEITGVCDGLASELSHVGTSVVIVSVNTLLHSNPLALSNETSRRPELGRNVWLWPACGGNAIECFNGSDMPAVAGTRSRTSVTPKTWLDSLRQNFEFILLDCPSLQAAPKVAVIASMAESAILAVDAAHASKHQILLDQRVLQLSGVKLVGCILIGSK